MSLYLLQCVICERTNLFSYDLSRINSYIEYTGSLKNQEYPSRLEHPMHSQKDLQENFIDGIETVPQSFTVSCHSGTEISDVRMCLCADVRAAKYCKNKSKMTSYV